MRNLIVAHLIVIGSFGLIGCSGKTAPDMTAAHLALKEAERTEAPLYAASDYHLAREKLERAEAASKRKKYEEARRLSEQVVEDARYAQVRSQADRAHEMAVKENTTARDLRAAQ